MRLLVTGGGTGGHINPALAIAQCFVKKDPDTKVLYAGTPTGMEARLVKEAGFDFAPIKVKGFRRSLSPSAIGHNVQAVTEAITSKRRANEIIRSFQPDLVIGTGGYVSGPVVLAASKAGIPTAIHEQNAFPGVTNRLLAKHVDRVFLAVGEAREHLDPHADYMVVGNPVRESILMKSKEEARRELGLDSRMCVLSFGGSLGADTINKIAADLMEWNHRSGLITHIHGYGRLGKEKFPALLKEKGIDLTGNSSIRASEYIHNMDVCMAAADLVICRAGAITISEIEATAKASILVPSPNVTANHQYYNALVLEKRGAAILLEEKDYSTQNVISIIESLYTDQEKITLLSQNAASLAVLDTAERIYKEMTDLVAKKRL